MANYTNQAAIESVLNRPLTATEVASLQLLLDAVDAFINNQIGSSFSIGDEVATRYYDSDSATMVDIDPIFIDETHGMVVSFVDADENVLETLDTSLYEARPRNDAVKTYIQLRNGRTWRSACSHAVANIAVTGYFGRGSTVPADIQYLAAYMAAQYIGASASATLKSESIEGYSRTFATIQSDYAIVSQTLDRYNEVLL